jgi:S1-C subfamily serine protease
MRLSRFAFFYKVIRDAALFAVLVAVVWPFAESFFVPGYADDTLPDEVVALDEKIEEFYQTTKDDFQWHFNNLTPRENYEFVSLTERVVRSTSEIFEATVPSIVYINTISNGFWYFGSGAILTSDGVIVTNYHVIEDSDTVMVATKSGDVYEVTEVLAYDKNLDIAFLKIDAAYLTPIPIGDSRAVEVGDPTLVIGHPEGLLNTLSLGNVSGIRDYRSQDAGVQFQITNPISMGNSGGAVINQYGELIGIPSWSLEYEDNSVAVQNVNFAVPMHEALELLKR